MLSILKSLKDIYSEMEGVYALHYGMKGVLFMFGIVDILSSSPKGWRINSVKKTKFDQLYSIKNKDKQYQVTIIISTIKYIFII